MPASVPRHPAWTTAASWRSGTEKRIGAQSAVSTPRKIPGLSATMPSASPISLTLGSATSAIWSPCTCFIVTTLRLCTPTAFFTSQKLSLTTAGSSPTRNERLSPANEPSLLPPRRPRKPCSGARRRSHAGTLCQRRSIALLCCASRGGCKRRLQIEREPSRISAHDGCERKRREAALGHVPVERHAAAAREIAGRRRCDRLCRAVRRRRRLRSARRPGSVPERSRQLDSARGPARAGDAVRDALRQERFRLSRGERVLRAREAPSTFPLRHYRPCASRRAHGPRLCESLGSGADKLFEAPVVRAPGCEARALYPRAVRGRRGAGARRDPLVTRIHRGLSAALPVHRGGPLRGRVLAAPPRRHRRRISRIHSPRDGRAQRRDRSPDGRRACFGRRGDSVSHR